MNNTIIEYHGTATFLCIPDVINVPLIITINISQFRNKFLIGLTMMECIISIDSYIF